jgi:hypothetical protein
MELAWLFFMESNAIALVQCHPFIHFEEDFPCTWQMH